MRRGRRGNVLTAAAVVIAAVLIAALVASTYALRSDFDDSKADSQALRSDVVTLRDQLLGLGETPDVGPAQPGERGDTGSAGERGRPGRDGRDGLTPGCLLDGSGCVSTVPGPAGADGRDGQDGSDGAPGADGADSTTPGPQGEPGQDGTNAPMCNPGYSMQPDTLRGADVEVCTKDPEPAP